MEPANIMDIEDLNNKPHKKNNYSDEQWDMIIKEFQKNVEHIVSKEALDKFRKHVQKAHKIIISNSDLIKVYNYLNLDDTQLRHIITKKKCKSNSGVLVITLLTSAYPHHKDEGGNEIVEKFSCKHDCFYCPNERAHEGNGWVDQPRSYLYNEPAVLRANQNKFDPVLQIDARLSTLIDMGHPVDKLEMIVLGGTWSEYDSGYQEDFIKKLYYFI